MSERWAASQPCLVDGCVRRGSWSVKRDGGVVATQVESSALW